MTERTRIAWLLQRAGTGVGPGELDELEPLGAHGVLDRLVDPDGAGVPVAPDPWAGIDLSPREPGDPAVRETARAVVVAWVRAMATTPRPLEERIRWFWHGHLVSALSVVKTPGLMVRQLRLYGERGLGDLRTLLRDVTVDPAMLVYLDGTENRAGAVNENYGRELLELFALGIGNYTEADVRAGAEALTGWRYRPRLDEVAFVPREHDDTPRRFLGVEGVHDLDSVIDAVVAHPACARFITGRLATALLGVAPDDPALGPVADEFAGAGLDLRLLVRRLLEAGLDGLGAEVVLAPVPWLVAALRATGTVDAVDPDALGPLLRLAGQVPMDPPNVGGWPGGPAWLSSSPTLARCNLAGLVAAAVPETVPAGAAAARRDWAGLADALGRPGGFGPATRAALDDLGSVAPATAALTVALASPELVIGPRP